MRIITAIIASNQYLRIANATRDLSHSLPCRLAHL
jgi:hypothetical protein